MGEPKPKVATYEDLLQVPFIATRGGDDEVAVPPFDAVPFSLAVLWAD